MSSILIADDHAVTRRGVRELLAESFEGVEIVEAENGAGLRAVVGTRAWRLVLLDVMMPGITVLESIAEVRRHHPTAPILVLTAATEIEYLLETMKAGANGLIHKHRASDELLEAIRRVEAGGTYLHADSAGEIARRLNAQTPLMPHQLLSERELEVFRAIAVGLAVKEIAGKLGISEKTVATYVGRIREKTGLQGGVAIARYALKHQLVD